MSTNFSGYVWDPYARIYKSVSGKPVDTSGTRKIVDEVRRLAAGRMNKLANRLKDGDLTNTAEFAIEFRDELKNLFVTTHVLARGGLDAMDSSDWGMLGQSLKEQYSYANSMVRDIENGLYGVKDSEGEVIIRDSGIPELGDAFINRVDLYANSAWGAAGEFENVVRDREMALGSLERRVLDPSVKEHCDECFVSGTAILTSTGWRGIETINKGDVVATSSGWKPVTCVITKTAKTLVHLKFIDRELLCTPNHPILLSDGEWKPAGEIDLWDEVVCSHDIPEVIKCKFALPNSYDCISLAPEMNVSYPVLFSTRKLLSSERFESFVAMPPISIDLYDGVTDDEVAQIPAIKVDLRRNWYSERLEKLHCELFRFCRMKVCTHLSALHKILFALIKPSHSSLTTSLCIFNRVFSAFESLACHFVNHTRDIDQFYTYGIRSACNQLSAPIDYFGASSCSSIWIKSPDSIIFPWLPLFPSSAGPMALGFIISQRLTTDTAKFANNALALIWNAIHARFSETLFDSAAFAKVPSSPAHSAQRSSSCFTTADKTSDIIRISAIPAHWTKLIFRSATITDDPACSAKTPKVICTDSSRALFAKKDHILVYNLEVEDDHNYIANGVVSHNCLELADRGWQPPGLMPDIGDCLCGPGDACVYEFENSELDDLARAFGHTQIGVPGNEPTEQPEFTLYPDEKSLKGGQGSGNFAHAGRPGEIGGSGEGGLKLKADIDKYFKPQKLDSPRDYITRFYSKTVHQEAKEQVLKTLDRLVTTYGKPPGGIEIATVRGGSAVASAGKGQRIPVGPEEAIQLHAAGEKIMDMQRPDGMRVLYHITKDGYSMSLKTDGPRGGKGWFGDKPENYGTKYKSVSLSASTTGRGHMDDTVTHEFGHIMTYMAGNAMKELHGERADMNVALIINSSYASTNKTECLAEAFKYYDAGGRDERVVKYLDDNIFSKLKKK